MSIYTERSNGTVPILAADTVIYTVPTGERISVSGLSSYSTAATNVTFYRSPDDTSASGQIISKLTFIVDDTLDITGVISTGFVSGERIIAVGAATGVNATLTYTLFTGDDV